MDWINSILWNGALAVRWVGSAIVACFVGIWDLFNALIGPILSWILSAINPSCTALGDSVYGAMQGFPPWVGLTILSSVAGVLMLIGFRYLSNQTAIGRVKDELKAHLLALKLFKDDLRVTAHSQMMLMWTIAKLQRYMLTPVLILMFPMLIAFAQMGMRHQWRPLESGEQTYIRVDLADASADGAAVTLEPCPGIIIEAPPIVGENDVVWRVRGGEAGRYTLRFSIGDTVVEKELVIGTESHRVNPKRAGAVWTDQLLYPAEPALEASSPIQSIEISYPPLDSWVYGSDYWLVFFFVVSMAVSLLLKPVFKVRF